MAKIEFIDDFIFTRPELIRAYRILKRRNKMELVCCSACGAVFAKKIVQNMFGYTENEGLVRQSGEPADPSFNCPVCNADDVFLCEI